MKLNNDQTLLQKNFQVTREGYNEYSIIPLVNKARFTITRNTTHHKYGKDMTYYIMYVSMPGEYHYSTTLHRFIWTYFKGNIPDGYDVDHINDNPMDNDISNLQLLTRQENVTKRGGGIGRNQYSYMLTNDEILQMRAEKKQIAEAKQAKRKERSDEYDYVTTLNNQWHQALEAQKQCNIPADKTLYAHNTKIAKTAFRQAKIAYESKYNTKYRKNKK